MAWLRCQIHQIITANHHGGHITNSTWRIHFELVENIFTNCDSNKSFSQHLGSISFVLRRLPYHNIVVFQICLRVVSPSQSVPSGSLCCAVKCWELLLFLLWGEVIRLCKDDIRIHYQRAQMKKINPNLTVTFKIGSLGERQMFAAALFRTGDKFRPKKKILICNAQPLLSVLRLNLIYYWIRSHWGWRSRWDLVPKTPSRFLWKENTSSSCFPPPLF